MAVSWSLFATLQRARASLLQRLRSPERDVEEPFVVEELPLDPREQVKQCGEQTFTWLNRPCNGTKLHMAALDGNILEVEHLLDTGVAAIDEEFGYLTEHMDKDQFCSGQAIHLAASRGHTMLVNVLLQRGADINSKVHRAGEPHYNVLHAAVYSEGRGGARGNYEQMLRFLVNSNADILNSYNGNGLSCMHVAFQTGDRHTIKLVQNLILEEASRELGLPCNHSLSDVSSVPELAAQLLALNDLEDEDLTDPKRTDDKKTPLEIGIKFRKMDKESLAAAAPKSISSLRVFIHFAPECIPIFMQRLARENDNRTLSEVLADKVSSKDIAKLLRSFPEAAASVLQSVTSRPQVVDEGWHPLPSRVSFASRNAFLRALGHFTKLGRFYTRYEEENVWSYNAQTYKAPEWHKTIMKCEEPPIFDALIQVCSIPNIISPNFFSAVLDASERVQPDALFLFKCVPIRAAVSYTFWNGAIWVDVAQFLVSVWGLGLLLVETFMAHEASEDSDMVHTKISRVFEPSFITDVYKRGVVADWIIAKGIVDLSLEVAQFRGCMVIREPMSYFRPGNLWDLMRSILPILLLWKYDSRVLQTFIVLIYWMRLLEGVTYSERIGHALLPLHKLANGLAPAMTFTLVGFCTLSHAMYTVQLETDHLWPKTLYKTFVKLITQGLPDDPPDDVLELGLLYTGVLFFSIFVMNIFIGVISEQYAKEKEQVSEMFQSLRASSCYTYLVRMSVIPCNWATKEQAAIIAFGTVALTFGLQVASLVFSWQLPGVSQLCAFILCQVVIFLASIQCKGNNYAWENFSSCSRSEFGLSRSYSSLPGSPRTTDRRKEKRYLWICQPRDAECIEGEKQMQALCRGLPRRGSTMSLADFEEPPMNPETLALVRHAIRQELAGSRDATYATSQMNHEITASTNNAREKTPPLGAEAAAEHLPPPPHDTERPVLLGRESRAGPFGMWRRREP